MKQEQQQLRIILLLVFTGFLGTSLAYPILPPLFLHPNHASMLAHLSQHWRVILLGISLALYPLGVFFGSPILGSLSDNHGRKPILCLSLSGAILGYILTAIAISFSLFYLLLIGRFFTGLMEGNIAIARSMAIDLKTLNKQKSLGLVNSISALAYIIGPILGGLLADKHIYIHFSFALPFYAASIMGLISLSLSKRLPTKSIKTIKPHKKSQQINPFKRLKTLHQHQGLSRIFVISTLFTLAVDIVYEYGPVYLSAKWHMMPFAIAMYNFGLALVITLAGISLPGYLTRFVSLKKAIAWTFAVATLLFALIPVSNSYVITYIPFTLLGLCIAVNSPNITTLLSNHAPDNIQGEVMGMQLSLRMLFDALICLSASALMLIHQGLPFLLSSAFSLLALLLIVQTRPAKVN